MKIIAVDNFDRYGIADVLVAENIRLKHYAEAMCKALNDKFCNSDDAIRYYKVVDDEHKLWRGMAELI